MTMRELGIVLLASTALACGSDEDRAREIERAASAAYEKGKAEAAANVQKERDEAERQAAAAQQQAELSAAAAQQEAVDRVQREKVALRKNPARFFGISETAFHDKGIVNSYRQLMQMTVVNKSRFAVSEVSGEVDWLKADGAKIGSTTFSLAGSLPAGEARSFKTQDGSLTASTLQGAAAKWDVRVTHVEVAE